MVGYIYLITDTTNNMKYVGQHHYNKEGELDPNYHGSGVIIKNIYKKRPETLIEEYVKTCYSEEEMCSDEQYYIKVFKTLWPNGYNLTEGGEGCVACEEIRKKISLKLKGRQFSEETRRKISENHHDCSGEKNPMFGKEHSEETRRKISNANKGVLSGEKNPMFGKHRSEETKKKISDRLKGKPAHNKGKPMSEEQKKKLSESKKGKMVGEKHPMFGKHLSEETKKKMSKSLKGLHSGEKHPMFGKHHTEESKKKMSDSHKGKPMSEEQKKKLSKIVLQFTLDGEFVREWKSTRECERNGFNHQHVAACCNGKLKTYKGFIWKYKE